MHVDGLVEAGLVWAVDFLRARRRPHAVARRLDDVTDARRA
jgi:hypothetical protein